VPEEHVGVAEQLDDDALRFVEHLGLFDCGSARFRVRIPGDRQM
jgi:hypothetical protein